MQVARHTRPVGDFKVWATIKKFLKLLPTSVEATAGANTMALLRGNKLDCRLRPCPGPDPPDLIVTLKQP